MLLRKFLIFVLLTSALFVGSPQSANASERGDWWTAKAEVAMAQFLATDVGTSPAFDYGMATGAASRLYGWSDPRTIDLLTKLRSTKKADGGYGLNAPYDFNRDGTINPATTSYTVSMAGHVGEALLGAYQAGLVPREEVQALVTKLARAPKVAVARGQCVAYSYNANDAGYCVHNVNSGVAWFLMQANDAGFGIGGMHTLITQITIQEVLAYRESQSWWPYLNNGTNQDADHQSYSAEAMYRLAYWVGRDAAYRNMITQYSDNSAAPMVHIRLTSLPTGPGSRGLVDPNTTLWCELGDRWKTEASNYLATNTAPARFAQFAYYASRNGLVC